MPIPCVDLLVTDEHGYILLLKRNNEPALGQWWFPGGRVHFGEMRSAAAKRKLSEECGFEGSLIHEVGTFDVLLKLPDGTCSHAITTLYQIQVANQTDYKLDGQSAEGAWRSYENWQKEDLHPFVRSNLSRATLG